MVSSQPIPKQRTRLAGVQTPTEGVRSPWACCSGCQHRIIFPRVSKPNSSATLAIGTSARMNDALGKPFTAPAGRTGQRADRLAQQGRRRYPAALVHMDRWSASEFALEKRDGLCCEHCPLAFREVLPLVAVGREHVLDRAFAPCLEALCCEHCPLAFREVLPLVAVGREHVLDRAFAPCLEARFDASFNARSVTVAAVEDGAVWV